jgi:hypothetical protein
MPVVGAPPFPDVTCGGEDFLVRKGETAVIPPGTYGDVEFQDNTDVRMRIGTYTMCSFHTGQDVTVSFHPTERGAAPKIVLRVARSFILSNDTQFGEEEDCHETWVYVRADGLNPENDNAVNLAKDTTVYGHFVTLEGMIALGNGTTLFGTFWGLRIISDWDVNIHPCAPPPPSPSTSPSQPGSPPSQSTEPVPSASLQPPPSASNEPSPSESTRPGPSATARPTRQAPSIEPTHAPRGGHVQLHRRPRSPRLLQRDPDLRSSCRRLTPLKRRQLPQVSPSGSSSGYWASASLSG